METFSTVDGCEATTCNGFAARTAIITGSSSGIGLGIARSVAAAGMNVVLNGISAAADINKARDDLANNHDVSVAFSAADMSKPKQIVQMVEDASRIFGQVDVLVNNAGILYDGPVEVTPLNMWDSIMTINLSWVFHAVRTVLPGIKTRGFGRIVNVSSALGVVGGSNYAAYAASKHAVVGLTKAAALETAQNGITIIAVCNGYVRTLLVEHEIEEVAKAISQRRRGSTPYSQPRPTDEALCDRRSNWSFGTLPLLGHGGLDHGGRHLYRRRLDRRVMY